MPSKYERAAGMLRTGQRLYKQYGPYVKAGYDLLQKTRKSQRSLKLKQARNAAPKNGGRYVVKSAARSRVRTSPGRLAGFTRKGKKVKRSEPIAQYLKSGAVMTTERSTNLTGVDTVYIGHATMPHDPVYKIAGMAIVKACFNDQGLLIPDWNAALVSGIGVNGGDQLVLEYRSDRDPANALVSSAYTMSSFALVYDLAIAIGSFIQSAATDAEFSGIYYFPVAASGIPFKKWNLHNSSITFMTKSSLKFQNRSVNEAGDEDAEDVDNVPLNGKSYHGQGSGTEYTSGTVGKKPFYADFYGLIAKDGDTDGIKEPPFGQLFNRVTHSGKVRINPGDIKTDVLQGTHSMKFNVFTRKMPSNAFNTTYPDMHMGKFGFFSLEKVIGGLSAQVISVAAEVNLLIGCKVKLGKPNYTTALFAKTTL